MEKRDSLHLTQKTSVSISDDVTRGDVARDAVTAVAIETVFVMVCSGLLDKKFKFTL